MIYITTEGITKTEACRKVFYELSPAPSISKISYTNQLKKLIDKIGQAELTKMADKAINSGLLVRSDLFPEKAAHADRMRNYNARLEELRKHVWSLPSNILQHLPPAPAVDVARIRRIRAFQAAFSDSIHDNLPAHEVDGLFDWMAELVAANFAGR